MNELDAMFELESFEAGGRKLHDGLADPSDPVDVDALVTEACRIKDRLDRLHRMADRDDTEWGKVLPTDNEGEFTLIMGGVLRELRQTEVVFKQVLAEISRRRSERDDDDPGEEGGLADL